MNITGISWQGSSMDDTGLFSQLPASLVHLLQEMNGFILHCGVLHVRGACMAPEWHSLHHAMQGPAALHELYESVRLSDIPFGQDLFGDQFLLRDEAVLKLYAESGEVEPLADSLDDFFRQIQEDVEGFLNVDLQHPLKPGQLLLACPPFVFAESGEGASLKPVSAAEVIFFHADLARQIRDVPDGGQIVLRMVDG